MNYLERYLSGEYQQVWDELVALGAAVREEPLYNDALAVASEMMMRAKHNCESLVQKLAAVGYVFKRTDTVLALANPSSIAQLKQAEDSCGPLPLALHAWYELVDEVDIRGTHPDWPFIADAESWLQAQINSPDFPFPNKTPTKPYVDTKALEITIRYLKRCGQEWLEDDTKIIIGICINEDQAIQHGDTAGDSEIIAPERRIDGYFRYPEDNIAPTFVGYLRKCFAWGGFPGFANVAESLRPTEMLEYLKEGLLPI